MRCAIAARVRRARRRNSGDQTPSLSYTGADGVLRSGRPVHVASPRRPAVHCGQYGLRLNARITLQASIASFGQKYQVLDRGCQPRAMGSPVRAVLAARMHATVPRLAYDRGGPTWMSKLQLMFQSMSHAATGC